jgi:cytosine/adenosine deaminase-related metal-dependent hydrolase
MRLLIAARNRAVAVEEGQIVAPEGAFDIVLEFPDAEIRPGLINAHDHLHRNHYGRLGAPPYASAYEWAEDIQARHHSLIAERGRKPRRDALLAGAWKNLFAGVTSVMHHDPWEEDFERDFPLRVLRVRNADSLGMAHSLDGVEGIEGGVPFCLHVGEGVDARASGEVRALDTLGLLGPGLIAVHGVGIDGEGIGRFRAAGAALTWCPSSNLFLFGRTAPAALLRDGLDVLLGSDSLLTGGGDLLDELACARSLGLLSDRRLEDAVGATAARRLGVAAPSLEPGAAAFQSLSWRRALGTSCWSWPAACRASCRPISLRAWERSPAAARK